MRTQGDVGPREAWGHERALSLYDRDVSAGVPDLVPALETIVLVGSFNPLILDPNWLLKQQVISQFELEQVQETGKALISRQVALMEFRTFSLQADPNRVQIAMTQEAETPLLLADVVAKIFGVLAHTPVNAVGLNHSVHRETIDDHAERILDLLAPQAAAERLLASGRVESLTWQADRDDDYAGRLYLSVQPSVHVQGLFLSVNDHFDLGDSGTGQSATRLVSEEWQHSLQRAEDVFGRVVGLV